MSRIYCKVGSEKCAEIAPVLIDTVSDLIWVTVYFGIGLVVIETINSRSFDIYEVMNELGWSKIAQIVITLTLATLWPILVVLVGYGMVKSVFSNDNDNDD